MAYVNQKKSGRKTLRPLFAFCELQGTEAGFSVRAFDTEMARIRCLQCCHTEIELQQSRLRRCLHSYAADQESNGIWNGR